VRSTAAEPTDLLGRWRLERRIVDRPTDGSRPRFGRVRGTLTLARSPGGADVTWSETGTLAWAGQELAVTRRLVIRRGGDGWTVCFDDGLPFHPWRPGAPVVHPCGADTYCGLVAVDDDHAELRVLWDVLGPAKDRRLFTRCTRT
jgi:Family of unknown function (DUF6314)